MKREIIVTSDGSTTIQLPDWNEQYHSKHGAIQEADHVFLKHGLNYFLEKKALSELAILEIGFGTGLNAFMTFLATKNSGVKVSYEGVEAYPVALEEVKQMNYVAELEAMDFKHVFHSMHAIEWGKSNPISDHFSLHKRKQFFKDIEDVNQFDIIYFDAFGARNQPELWTEVIFQKMINALKSQGVLVTYSAKGSVRRAMQAVGFSVERLPGPPGKREMLRATKP